MSGSTLRRAVLGIFVITLILPLASARAVPAKRSESRISAMQLTEWSRTLWRSAGEWLSFFRPAAAASSRSDRNHQSDSGNDGPQTREGNGIDPHGGSGRP